MGIGTIVFLVVLAVFITCGVGVYNNFVAARNILKNGFAQIDVQLQQRYYRC